MTLLDWLKQLGGKKSEPTSAPALDDDLDIDPFNPFPEPVEIEISDVIDLHTVPPREVKAVVEEYLRQAREAGFPSVRIIHGKGIGVQREIVQKILARTSFVTSWTDAPADGGGWGATVAHLDRMVDVDAVE
jgi:dsDNA-specific endonuclease/ATPase MutS2